MTPEEIEARFQRIEAILVQTAEQNAERDERMDLMMIGINSLVESSIEYKRWKPDTDQRFNILLEEVRTMNRRIGSLENQS
jgi:vacuolar-type H+-ATPase subunit D/Vma8